MTKEKITPVILAGGKGTRLWPISREDVPKQFCAMDDGQSLFQKSICRVQSDNRFTRPIVVTGERYCETVRRQLDALNCAPAAIISEPEGRDTAAAVLLASELPLSLKSSLLLVMPSDHLIANESVFFEAVDEAAASAANDGVVVTFGIKPTHPETGFGYLRAGDESFGRSVRAVADFIEKPDEVLAERLLQETDVFWNAGIFLFDRQTMREEFHAHAPFVLAPVADALASGKWAAPVFSPGRDSFAKIPAISLDYAIMERTDRAAMIPVDPDWSDLGSWKAMWDVSDKDEDHNVLGENCFVTNSKDCLVRSDGPVVGVAGLDDVVVVACRDAVMVTSRSNPQDVKELVEQLHLHDIDAAKNHPGEDRPWGRFDSLNKGACHQVKSIRVDPAQRLSLQYHHHRAEHWVVVRGTATVTVGDKVVELNVGEQIYIPKGEVHRLENFTESAVEIIEVQIGDYLGEDDIVRVDDVYGRSPTSLPSKQIAA